MMDCYQNNGTKHKGIRVNIGAIRATNGILSIRAEIVIFSVKLAVVT
jgi:hypothetical protein